MNSTHTISMISALLIGLSPEILAANDELWQKCVTFVNNAPTMVPGRIELKETVTDEKGKIHQDSSTTLDIFSHEPGIGVHLVRFLENGKDAIEDSREMIEGVASSELRSWKQEIPFIATDPTALVAGLHPDRLNVRGSECIGYRFEIDDSNIAEAAEQPFHLKGVIWIDPETAVPMQIDTEMVDLPKKDGDAEILSFTRTVTFSTENGSWIKDSESLDVELKAKMLFGRKNFKVRNRTSFHKHWNLNAGNTTSGTGENPPADKIPHSESQTG